jgi:hypothetical protein
MNQYGVGFVTLDDGDWKNFLDADVNMNWGIGTSLANWFCMKINDSSVRIIFGPD